MNIREAAEMALKNLQSLKANPNIEIWSVEADNAITALRQALAQSEQEPVSENKWKNVVVVFNDKDEPPITGNEYDGKVLNRWSKNFDVYLDGIKGHIYTTPPKREWVGLTDEDRQEFAAAQHKWEELCAAVEAKLKEKNG